MAVREAPKTTPRIPYRAKAPGTTRLFCYGTLNVHAIQREIWGEAMQGRDALLRNYELRLWPNSAIFYIERKPGESVVGKVYELTQEQLDRTDLYEGEAYKRITIAATADSYSFDTYIKA